MRKLVLRVLKFFSVFSATLAVFWAALARWVFMTWAELQMEELVYELKAPLQGTGSDLVLGGVKNVIVPAVCALVLMLVLIRVLRSSRFRVQILSVISAVALAVLVSTSVYAWNRLDMGAYLEATGQDSEFIRDHYVDPAEVRMTFPQEKRNLVYIFLESIETTFADQSVGGAMAENIIPELTALSMEGEDFSQEGMLNGAHALQSTGWTMAGMFAHTSGLPLKISIDSNAMNTQKAFFSGMTNLGDILKKEGYHQALMVGSDGEFGGRALYFREHGNYDILDYKYALAEELIPPSHYVWWGYEDARLFEIAKQELTDLAAADEPFNLTMLTVDTHFEDGYVCEYCSDTYGDDQYSNVISCSSRMVTEFVRWIQAQDFYENTTIVIAGDHRTMDSNYCDAIPEDYVRKVYATVINAAAEKTTAEAREYSTFDLFPTTLAAMGVEIEGDRLGLGVNLFSQEKTIVEEFGLWSVNRELRKNSPFMDAMGNIQTTYPKATIQIDPGEKDGTILVSVCDIKDAEEEIRGMNMTLTAEDGRAETIRMKRGGNKIYTAEADISHLERGYGTLALTMTGKSGREYELETFTGNLLISSVNSLNEYLGRISELEGYSILMAAADEMSTGMHWQARKKLAAMGIASELKKSEAYRKSFYAVITPDGVAEEISEQMVSTTGTLPDGSEYYVRSRGRKAGNKTGCMIIIDDVDYAPSTRGLNVVVYDHVLGKVADVSAFDTYLVEPSAKASVDSFGVKNLYVTVSDVKLDKEPGWLTLRFWSGLRKDTVHEVVMIKQEDGSFVGRVNLPYSVLDKCYMAVYGVNAKDEEVRLATLESWMLL